MPKIDPMKKAHFTRAVKKRILECSLDHGFAGVCDDATANQMIATMNKSMASRASRKESTHDDGF